MNVLPTQGIRVCRKCEVPKLRDVDFAVYRRGQPPRRRRVCNECLKPAQYRYRAKVNPGYQRRIMVPVTDGLVRAVEMLVRRHGRIDLMLEATGLSKSAYNRIVRQRVPRVERRIAELILQAAWKECA